MKKKKNNVHIYIFYRGTNIFPQKVNKYIPTESKQI